MGNEEIRQNSAEAKTIGRTRISSHHSMLAVIGGSIGALLGMKVWRHKTQHKKFKYGLPLILLAQIALFNFIS